MKALLLKNYKELELVDSYLKIEKARFGERLHIIFDIDETIFAQTVLRIDFIIQI